MQGTPMFAAIHDRGQVFPRTIFPLGAKFLIIPQPSASSTASQTSLRFGAERRRGLSRAEWGEMDCDEEDRQETGECVWSGVAEEMGCQPRVFYEGGRGEWGGKRALLDESKNNSSSRSNSSSHINNINKHMQEHCLTIFTCGEAVRS